MSRMIDETGNIYGYLTVIKRGPNGRDGRVQWICDCKCGTKEIIVSGSQLRNGKTKSCGCYQKEQTMKACIKNLTGQTIGNFYVIESFGSGKGGHLWRCKCLLCGNENAIINSSNIEDQYSCGCSISSKGERKIKDILNNNNINYIQEKRFADCVFEDTNKTARFDFFLPKYNCLIEFDGRQHFIQSSGIFDNEEKFKRTQEHDKIKNEYCFKNNILLIRIPYTHFDKITIEDLLPDTSQFLLKD